MANCKTNQATNQAFWQDSKRADVRTTLAFMHTHKNAHAPPSSFAKAYTHRPVGTHMCIHIYTCMFILGKHMHMARGVVYTASDAVLPFIPYHSFS